VHIVTEFFECVRAFNFEIASAVAVRIDIRDAVRAQFVIVLLGPLVEPSSPGSSPSHAQ